jgi:prephenate dehydratase
MPTDTTVNTKQTIAIQGIRGSFHHEAASLFFRHQGNGTEVSEFPGQPYRPENGTDLPGYKPCLSFKEVTAAVRDGHATHGVMAVENSLVGGMLPNFSLIRDASLHITGEVYMRITQNLMALPGESIGSLREVHSHPMAIMQAEAFFEKLPHIRLVESADTAESAREISDGRLQGIGAIASASASKMYGLPVLAASIETNKENFTRFLVLGREPAKIGEGQIVKASLAFIAPHRPGSLVDVLLPLASSGVNLSMLQSLPMVGKSWEYIFHADLVFGDIRFTREVIEGMKERLEHLWVMGVYPAGQGIEQCNVNKRTK